MFTGFVSTTVTCIRNNFIQILLLVFTDVAYSLMRYKCNSISQVSRLNFSLLRLDKAVSRAGRRNVMCTALLWWESISLLLSVNNKTRSPNHVLLMECPSENCNYVLLMCDSFEIPICLIILFNQNNCLFCVKGLSILIKLLLANLQSISRSGSDLAAVSFKILSAASFIESKTLCSELDTNS